MATVILTGIPGSGKTTVLKKALSELGAESRVYEHVVYGTVMFEIAKEKGLVSDRDEMRNLPVDAQREVQVDAARKIGKLGETKDIIVDTHCTVKTPKGFIPGLPKHVLDEIKPSQIIIIETDVQDIIERRKDDASRKRDLESSWGLDSHQKINRSYAAAYSLHSNSAVKLIANRQGKLAEASAELKKVLT